MAPEGQTGKSVVALGIVDALTREVESVGVFRPIIKGTEPDQILTALLRQPAVQQEYDESYGVTYQDVRRDADEALATIVRRYGEVAGHFDAVVILGSDYRDALGAPELGLNARIAANLNAPVAFCVSARGRSPEEVVQYARSSLEELKKHHATTIAVIPTRVPPGHEEEYRNAVGAAWSDVVAGVIPDHRVLAAPVLAAQVASLSLTVGSSVGASASSSWQSVTQTKYWFNTNGARSASYRSNMVVAPQQDYRSNTVWIQNTAYVKFRGDARNWQIIASA